MEATLLQDYINIPGLRLWQEEISRIVNFAVEREAAGFLKVGGLGLGARGWS